MNYFCERLKELRLKKNLTQQEFADICDVTKKSQQNYESGKRSPDANYLMKLVDAGYDVKYLLTGEKDRSKLNHQQSEWLNLLDNASPELREDALDVLMFEQSGNPKNDQYIRITKISAQGSFAYGSPAGIQHDEAINSIIIKIDWLENNLLRFSTVNNLRIVNVISDSMSGTFEEGDVLFVDMGVTELTSDGIYMFELDGIILIKRLHLGRKGVVHMIPDNKKYPAHTILPEDYNQIRVIGRIVGKWALTRF